MQPRGAWPRWRCIVLAASPAAAQTMGLATLQPGSLNHIIGVPRSPRSPKEKAGLNMLVQPTAGDTVIVPLVGRGEAEFGLANIMEAQDGLEGGRLKDLRLIGAVQALRDAVLRAQGLRHAHHRRPQGQARGDGLSRRMRNIDIRSRAPCSPPPA